MESNKEISKKGQNVRNMESNKGITTEVQNAAETISSTVLAVIDKLTGKQANVKLGFEDLMLESDLVKVKINGAIVLEIITRQQ